MHIPLLADIAIIFAVSIGILFLCHRLGIPSIVGFLLTGILAGPHGLGLVAADKDVEILAEVGVILLLFTIGIEFSLKGLRKVKRAVLLGGALQVGLTIALVTLLATLFKVPLNQALFLGFLVALSSTAIVLKALQDRSEIDTPHGRTILAILIFQDIVIVLMMLAVPILANPSEADPVEIALLLGKGVGVVTLVLIGARYLVPRLLHAVVYTRSRELFLLTIVVLCFATAWLTSQVGLSLALGAFLAGLVISESEYSHQAFSIIIPFRDTFTSLFFVSVGMLLNPQLLLSHPLPIIGGTLAVLILKFLTASTASLTLGLSLRVVLLTSLGLSQIGEFSFILSKVGNDYGLISEEIYGIFIAISVLSMAATPFIINAAPRLVDAIVRHGLPQWLHFGGEDDGGGEEGIPSRDNHIVIIGYGLNGTNVARAARHAQAEYVIIELNRELVRQGKEESEPIYFGDAAQVGVLERAGLEKARVAVVVISDPIATRSIVATARQMNPGLYIIARTRFVKEVEELYQLGANEVIPEEYETSIEIFARVLACYHLPKTEIESFVENVRAEGYEMLRKSSTGGNRPLSPLDLPDVEVESIRIEKDSDADGKTLAELNLRKEFGVTLLAIRRGGETISNPSADTLLLGNDLLILLGSPSNLRQLFGVCGIES